MGRSKAASGKSCKHARKDEGSKQPKPDATNKLQSDMKVAAGLRLKAITSFKKGSTDKVIANWPLFYSGITKHRRHLELWPKRSN